MPLRHDRRLALDSFSIFQFQQTHEITLRDVVGLEHITNQLLVDGDPDTYQFRLAFGHLEEEALSPEESRELILTTSRQVWA
jgi:hypothetical protein